MGDGMGLRVLCGQRVVSLLAGMALTFLAIPHFLSAQAALSGNEAMSLLREGHRVAAPGIGRAIESRMAALEYLDAGDRHADLALTALSMAYANMHADSKHAEEETQEALLQARRAVVLAPAEAVSWYHLAHAAAMLGENRLASAALHASHVASGFLPYLDANRVQLALALGRGLSQAGRDDLKLEMLRLLDSNPSMLAGWLQRANGWATAESLLPGHVVRLIKLRSGSITAHAN
ncbi:MAG: hypothetical protein H6851_11855 [Geminicoccaceae bacterium]|nr:hypothetical protein [Geminicoccaceae bacterium]MCB9944298.1 hypothetical protein [Geminicoccaceae bacterium]